MSDVQKLTQQLLISAFDWLYFSERSINASLCLNTMQNSLPVVNENLRLICQISSCIIFLPLLHNLIKIRPTVVTIVPEDLTSTRSRSRTADPVISQWEPTIHPQQSAKYTDDITRVSRNALTKMVLSSAHTNIKLYLKEIHHKLRN